MKKNVRYLTLTLLILASGFAYGQTYTEDFEDGDVSDWQQYRINEEMIQVVANAAPLAVLATGGDSVGYIQDIDGSYSGAAILLVGDTLDSDYTVEADVYVYENAAVSAYTGIVAYGDSAKGYYVKLVADFDASDRFRLYNNQLNFTTFQYSFYAEPPTAGIDKTEGWHHMKMRVTTDPTTKNVNYQCWYDSTYLGTYVDSSAGHTSSGQAGVYAFQQDSDGIAGYFDNFKVEPSDWTSVKEFKGQPVTMSLRQNYPNPFNPSTTISFDIHEAGQAKLQIFNVKGELVQTLANGYIRSGAYELNWNGTDHYGNKVASGSYLVLLSRGNEQLSRSMLMLK